MANQDPAEVRDAARQILDQAQFHRDDRGLLSRIYYYLTHPVDAFEDAWNWLLGRLPWSDTGASIFAWILVVLVVIVAVYVVVRVGSSTMRDAGIEIREPTLPHTQSAAELLAVAAEHERNHEWADALRARYGALLAQLGDAGVVQRRVGRTVGEYKQEVRANHPAISDAFTSATTMFELAWYGNRPTTVEDVEAFRHVAEAIRPKKVA